ncbi:hypothetical protein SEA_ATUIN_294 [Arthrobacter phage Atuin]|nr:hypothetical protein SEA_ATUIN_93 [Arthrobacter phage Atuin]
MLDFEEGTHVIVELYAPDEEGGSAIEVVGGFIDSVSGMGLTLRTTHRKQKIVPKITDKVAGEIKRAVSEIPVWLLRVAAAIEVRDPRALFKLTVEDMRKIVENQQEQLYVKQNTHYGMAPLASSVRTFYSIGTVRSAEVTEDYNVETAMAGLDGILDFIRDTVKIEKEETADDTGTA